MARLLQILLFCLLIAVLPFILLVRLSVYFHEHYELSAYSNLAISVLSVAILLFLYFTVLHGFITGRIGEYAGIKRRWIIALLIVLLYAGHALFFFSSDHLKSRSLSKEFSELHPIIRLATSTISHIDDKLILTDAERVPEDYKRMGLPTSRSSLHYKQSDGYVYAIDIRVKGRSEIRNMFTRLYFKLMGFKTLRHVGTDDHLHISLHCHDKPGSI